MLSKLPHLMVCHTCREDCSPPGKVWRDGGPRDRSRVQSSMYCSLYLRKVLRKAQLLSDPTWSPNCVSSYQVPTGIRESFSWVWHLAISCLTSFLINTSIRHLYLHSNRILPKNTTCSFSLWTWTTNNTTQPGGPMEPIKGVTNTEERSQ